MKKLFLILLISMSLNVFGQLRVKEGSFIHKPNAVMDDKQDHYDDNDEPMALIKISTENINETERGRLAFRATNRSAQVQKKSLNGQIWLYISTSADELEITHPDYSLIKYKLPETLCGFCTYEMVLSYIPVSFANSAKPQNNFVTIIADQPNAAIYIDDDYLGDKEAAKSLLIGSTHTWKIECDLYHTETGIITVKEDVVIEKTLRPAFGYLEVKSTPENAVVFINNKRVGETPYTSDKLASGVYKVRVVKEMYKTTENTFVVTDGNTTKAVLDMLANFVTVTINTDAESDIYVDEQYKGRGSWTGNLSEGSHFVEARKESHRDSEKNINLVLGKYEIITLNAPQPIYGFLEINSSPLRANIYIDGKLCGQTPKVLSDLLIGERELKLEKQGYLPLTKTISVVEGETLSLNETLQNEMESAQKQYELGDDYYYGYNGVTKDYYKAVEHYRKAAELGHADAQLQLGYCYDIGAGVSQDCYEAVKWYRKSAEQGNIYAQHNLGNSYYNGEGVTKDYYEAVKWYRKAADQGYASAQNNLGSRYYNGEGVGKDYYEAVKWYRKSADQGNEVAQSNLGLCYRYGNGVTKDLIKAKEWYQKAADNGYEKAKEKLKEIEDELDDKITGEMQDVTVEYDVFKDGVKGMKILVDFTVQKMKGINGSCAVYFYYENGNVLKDANGKYKTSDGQTATHVDITPGYDDTIYTDLEIFMPYSELEVGTGKHELKFYCVIWENSTSTANSVTESQYYHFTLTK